MLPRRELKKLVRDRLQSIPPEVLDRLIAEIDDLGSGWEEMNPSHLDGVSCTAVNCLDCWLEEQRDRGMDVKMFLKRPPRTTQAAG